MQISILTRRISIVLEAISLVVLALFLPRTLSAAEYCSAKSAIDQVPFFIGQSYSDLLGRTPDSGGQRQWINQLEDLNAKTCRSANPATSAGNCEWNNNAQITLAFLASPEFRGMNGDISSNNAFVTTLYRVLLHREPDAAGLKSHLSTLNSRGSRQSVVFNFLSSDEYRRRFTCTAGGTSYPSCNGSASIDPIAAFVTQTQQDLLGLTEDPTPMTAYLTSNQTAMCRNVSATAYSVCDRVIEAQMITNILNGSQYGKSNPPISDNRAFVNALYEHLLRRQPDSGGLEGYTNTLNQTNDRVGLAYIFLTSNEYRKRFACRAGPREFGNLGFNGHPLRKQGVYAEPGGVSFDTQLEKVRDAGGIWYRFDVSAPSGGADFTKMDALVQKAQAHGVQLLPGVFAVFDRDHDSPSTIYQKARDGAINMVGHYKSIIHVWELLNEMDNTCIHVKGDPGIVGTPAGDQATDYSPQRFAIVEATLRGLADGVRAADPTALRVINFAGWLHTGFLQLLEDHGVPYDIAAIHWYQDFGEITCPGQSLPCPSTPKWFNVVQRVRTITNDKPIWITEMNYRPTGTDPAANAEQMRAYLPQVLQTYTASPAVYPFQTLMIYELFDQPGLQAGTNEKQSGMFQVTRRPDGGYDVGPAKTAYQAVRDQFKR